MVTPIGVGREEFWRNAVAGKSGIRPVQSFDTSAFRVHNGAEVIDFRPGDYVRHLAGKPIGRCSQLAIAAARLALSDAGLQAEELRPERVAVILGSTMGESGVLEEIDEAWVRHGPDKIDPCMMSRYPCHVVPANVAGEFGFRGPNVMIPTACAAGNHAIGHGMNLLQSGRADLVLAGGADSFSRLAFTGFARLAAIAPEKCQPFSKDRKGMMVGEGAGVLILETLESARHRGASIYAELLGYGLSCDAHHMTASHPEGLGTAAAMKQALEHAGVRPEDVDYISAHGTGTPTNDRMETLAIRRAFQDQADKVAISSIKSMIGHTMGAASALEAAACALAIHHGVIPPTINYQEPDPECDLDYVPNEARERTVRIAVNNSAAFGGNNAVTVFGAPS
jgi:3-oxoacyl-[acyl-carrier-protein] synthase II